MKRLLCFLLILCLLPALCGCGAEPARRGSGPLQIVTTVFPACDFAHIVAGEQATVTLIVPPGAELHSFEPTAQDLLLIRGCDLFVCTGGESEAWVEELLEGQDGEIPTLVMLECVDALEEEEKEGMQEIHEEEAGEEEGPEYDEHVWTSPVNAQRICRAIAARLGEIDPAHAADFEANAERCCAELAALDAQFREITAGAALALALGIAIQNFPEGAIISMPLRAAGKSKPRAFADGVLSGAVEPVAAVVTILASRAIGTALPYLLSFAAGAMLYVVVEELIPEMSEGKHSNVGTVAFALGFVVMMILDVTLG